MKKVIKKASASKSKIKKAQTGISAKRDNTRVDSSNAMKASKAKVAADKDAKDYKKISGKYSAIAVRDRESSFPGDSVRYFPGQRSGMGVPYIKDLGNRSGVAQVSKKQLLEASRDKKNRTYQDTSRVKANKDIMSNQKNGGKTSKTSVVKKVVKSIKKKK